MGDYDLNPYESAVLLRKGSYQRPDPTNPANPTTSKYTFRQIPKGSDLYYEFRKLGPNSKLTMLKDDGDKKFDAGDFPESSRLNFSTGVTPQGTSGFVPSNPGEGLFDGQTFNGLGLPKVAAGLDPASGSFAPLNRLHSSVDSLRDKVTNLSAYDQSLGKTIAEKEKAVATITPTIPNLAPPGPADEAVAIPSQSENADDATLELGALKAEKQNNADHIGLFQQQYGKTVRTLKNYYGPASDLTNPAPRLAPLPPARGLVPPPRPMPAAPEVAPPEPSEP